MGIFTNQLSQRLRSEGSFQKGITMEAISKQREESAVETWLTDPVGSGIKNTQQLLIDWSSFENHVFFHSAEAKVNIALDKIINTMPFDGTVEEKIDFLSNIDGYTKHLIDSFPTYSGSAYFDGTHFIETKDKTGWLLPEAYKKKVGLSTVTKLSHEKGFSVEFWIKQDVASEGYILQKASDATTGVSLYTEVVGSGFSVNLHLSSSDYRSIVGTTGELALGEWHHVAIVYHRNSIEKMIVYLNGTPSNTIQSDHKMEMNEIELPEVPITIGYGDVQQVTQAATTPATSETFVGYLDEFRLWSKALKRSEIKEKYLSNISASPDLQLYFRFNEPPSSYDPDTGALLWASPTVILDYSGNGMHAVMVNGLIDDFRNSSIIGAPILENPIENIVLFPDYPEIVDLNTSLIKEANLYDKNNPNIITKLIPAHYFEEAKFFEGIEKDLDEPMTLGMNTPSSYGALPGQSKVPSRTIILSFLMLWAAYFDDIKLYIDSFSSLDKVSYTGKNQIPPILIDFLKDYYQLPLINPYGSESLDKWQDGRNLTDVTTRSQGLSSVSDQMWRRVLVNMPFLMRSRGTIQGVKALMNTLGLEADSYFRFHEYGGKLSNTISSSRVEETIESIVLDLSSDVHAFTPSLKAYRHASGYPDPANAPQPGAVIFQSGDISIVEPADPPIMTSFLSGSWSHECHVTLSQSHDSGSLFHIVDTTDSKLVANLVAHKAPENTIVEHKLSFFCLSYKDQSTPSIDEVSIEGINLWDGNEWFVSVSHGWNESTRDIKLSVGKVSGTNIIEWYDKEESFNRVASDTVSDLGFIDPLNDLILEYSTNAVFSNAGDFGDTGAFTDVNGKIKSPKFWTKALTEDENFEHAKNPLSIFVEDPITNRSISARQSDGTPIGSSPNIYPGSLPLGSWERLRMHYPGLEGIEEATASSSLIDATQNNLHLTVSSSSIFDVQKYRYSVVSPTFDSSATSNKVRVRSYQSAALARANNGHYGELYELPTEVGLDDKRFGIESSIVHALNKDIVNLLGDMRKLNDYLGAPELEYAVDYPEIRKIREQYFERLVSKMPYNSVIEFQRWFNNNFSELVETFIPYTADFLGINFLIESHMLERHKFEYKQGDIHVDLRDRQAFSQEPIIIGTVTNGIS
jgi:hypothetical protein